MFKNNVLTLEKKTFYSSIIAFWLLTNKEKRMKTLKNV